MNETAEEDCIVGTCPIALAISIVGGKWKIPILYYLRESTLRFGELKKELPQVTQKMLTQQLRELEKDQLVLRKVYAQVPPKVEYSTTALAKTLEPILDSLCKWGQEYQEAVGKPIRNHEPKDVPSK